MKLNPQKVTKLINFISYATLALAFGMITTLFYWSVYPYKPIVISITAINTTVKAGDSLFYQADYCKYMQLPATVSRSFVDGIIFSTASIVADNPVGCRTSKMVIEVPKGLISGEYTLKIIYSYQVNPIRHVDVVTVTNPFTVVGIDLDNKADSNKE